MNQNENQNVGRVTQVIGSTFDAEFAEGRLPAIYNALYVEKKTGDEVSRAHIKEVILHTYFFCIKYFFYCCCKCFFFFCFRCYIFCFCRDRSEICFRQCFSVKLTAYCHW